MYIALHNTRIGGRMITPGEVFDDTLPAEKEERLLRLKAICKIDEEDEKKVLAEMKNDAPAVDDEETERKAKKPAPAPVAEEGEAAAISPDMDMTDAIVTKKRRKR